MKISISIALITASCALATHIDPLSDEFIEYINSKNSTWKAGRNFHEKTPLSLLHGLLGAIENPTTKLQQKSLEYERIEGIPEFFDAREQWPMCQSIKEIRDQSECGSCWAFAATEAISDRICIHSKGKKQVSVSAEDLMSCCDSCGDGCHGGQPDSAWKYWVENGIVTGGGYQTTNGCKSYKFAPCAHYVVTSERPVCSRFVRPTPLCIRKCDNSSLIYENQLTFGNISYSIAPDETEIQFEILQNGPVEAGFNVYHDFLHYKTGVYQHVAGNFTGYGHAIKIIGWGIEDNTPYWLIANSWNTYWGDNGYIKFLRGENHCGIEANIVAGLPKL